MKKIIFLLGLLLPLTLSGQNNDQAHFKQIDEHLTSKLLIEKNPIESPFLNKVFAGSFYRIGIFFVYEEENSVSSYGCHDCYINITDGNLTEFQQLSSDQELKELFSFLRSDFHLRNETDAAAFEAALNVLYPVEKEEQGNVKHINKASQWIFIRGKFFDNDTAVIVTTDQGGIVSRIELKLSYNTEG